jgi:hypothetical protein
MRWVCRGAGRKNLVEWYLFRYHGAMVLEIDKIKKVVKSKFDQLKCFWFLLGGFGGFGWQVKVLVLVNAAM